MKTRTWLALPFLLVFQVGCRSAAPSGPYSPPSERTRETSRAEALNREAADLMTSDPERAEERLREALTRDLFFGPAHNNLGVLLLERGELFEAANEFEWARKLLPGHPDPRFNLAVTLERAGDDAAARESYRAALEVHPGDIASIQGLTRNELLNGIWTDASAERLDEIALRGEPLAWREWALARRGEGLRTAASQ